MIHDAPMESLLGARGPCSRTSSLPYLVFRLLFVLCFFYDFFLSDSVLLCYEEQRLNQEQTGLWVSYLATHLSTPVSTPTHLCSPDIQTLSPEPPAVSTNQSQIFLSSLFFNFSSPHPSRTHFRTHLRCLQFLPREQGLISAYCRLL